MKNLSLTTTFLRLRAVVGGGVLALSLVGCATSGRVGKTILIESEPTGVRVEVNGEDLGRTPTSYTVRPDAKGNFPGGWGDTPTVVFTAFPSDGSIGLRKQIKAFNPAAFMDRGDRVPERIFFDMHQEPGR